MTQRRRVDGVAADGGRGGPDRRRGDRRSSHGASRRRRVDGAAAGGARDDADRLRGGRRRSGGPARRRPVPAASSRRPSRRRQESLPSHAFPLQGTGSFAGRA